MVLNWTFFSVGLQLWLLAAMKIKPVFLAKYATEKDLCEHLLENYTTFYRPVRNSSQVVEVTMQLYIEQMLALDEKSQMMSSQVAFMQTWKDEFLYWNISDYDSQVLLTIPKNHIWDMDLYVKNSVGDSKASLEAFHKKLQTYILVAEGGHCMAFYPFVLYTSCHMDLALFPFDIQTCNITTGSWAYDSKQVKLKLAVPAIYWRAQSATVGEWNIISSNAVIKEEPYMYHIEDSVHTVYFDEITFSITVIRNPSFYIFNIIIPTAILGVVAVFSFLLPPDSGERISLCLTTLLAIAVYVMVVADSVPESSKCVPLITRLLFLFMAVIAVSTLWSVLAVRFHYQVKHYTTAPGYILRWFTKFSRPLNTEKTISNDDEFHSAAMETPQDSQLQTCDKQENENESIKWQQVIAGLDMFLFIIFLIVLVVGTLLFFI